MTTRKRAAAFDLTNEPETVPASATDYAIRHAACWRDVYRSRRAVWHINTFITVFDEITGHSRLEPFSRSGMKEIVAPMYDRGYSALIEDLWGACSQHACCNLASSAAREDQPRGGRTIARNAGRFILPGAASKAVVSWARAMRSAPIGGTSRHACRVVADLSQPRPRPARTPGPNGRPFAGELRHATDQRIVLRASETRLKDAKKLRPDCARPDLQRRELRVRGFFIYELFRVFSVFRGSLLLAFPAGRRITATPLVTTNITFPITSSGARKWLQLRRVPRRRRRRTVSTFTPRL